MPVLSLHNNTYSLPSGSASYTLGLSGAPGTSSYTTYPTGVTSGGLSSILGTGGLTGTSTGVSAGLTNLLGGSGGGGVGTHTGVGLGTTTGLGITNPLSSSILPSNLGYNTTAGYSTYTNPLLTSGGGGGATTMNMKLKAYDDLDLLGRYNRAGTPSSPIPPAPWGMDTYGGTGLDGVNPAFMHAQRPLSRGGHDLERKHSFLNLNSI